MSIEREAADVIRRYGTDHADTYGDIRWDQDHYVVSFIAQLDDHRNNLRSLVGDPSMVEVEATRYTSAYLTDVIQAVRAEFRVDARRVLGQSGPGQVTLRAPFADVAGDLHQRYGDALEITVGSKAFPPERIIEFRAVPLPVSTVELPDLDIEFHFETTAAVAGDDLRGAATLTNRGQDRLHFITGLMTGGVRHLGDDNLAGAFRGGVTAVGFERRSPPRSEQGSSCPHWHRVLPSRPQLCGPRRDLRGRWHPQRQLSRRPGPPDRAT
jgi:hypothetical protein